MGFKRWVSPNDVIRKELVELRRLARDPPQGVLRRVPLRLALLLLSPEGHCTDDCGVVLLI